MGVIKKSFTILLSVLLLICVANVFIKPDLGYALIMVVAIVYAYVKGISNLIYFFTLAKHMVGGKYIFYKGVFFLDVAVFITTLSTINTKAIIIVILLLILIGGVREIVEFVECVKNKSRKWGHCIVSGIYKISIVAVGIIFISRDDISLYCIAVYLVGVAIKSIINVFRRTSIIYIQ